MKITFENLNMFIISKALLSNDLYGETISVEKKYLQKTVNGTVNSTLNEGQDGNISN